MGSALIQMKLEKSKADWIPSSVMLMRWSADVASSSAASFAPPKGENSSAWILILNPAALAALTNFEDKSCNNDVKKSIKPEIIDPE